MGTATVQQRLSREGYKHADPHRKNNETRAYMRIRHHLFNWVLQLTGLKKRARANALDLQILDHEIHFPGLPDAFDRFTLLHLSDLHLEILPELADRIIEKIKPLQYDLCIITGDFCEASYTDAHIAQEQIQRICRHIPTRIIGIMGNHDFLQMVAPLEAAGIEMLLNESTTVEKQGEKLYLAGVDDPHFYQTHDLARALNNIPASAFKILLAHSAECYQEAEEDGIDLYLCGHTHGGQFCLPGKIPIKTNTRSPSKMTSGTWQHGNLKGYTSCGTGISSVVARFNCPPEITLHCLRHTPAP